MLLNSKHLRTLAPLQTTFFLLLILMIGGCDVATYIPDRDSSRRELPRTEVPRPPVAIEAGVAERDLAITKRMGENYHHTVDEVNYLIGRFDRARTQKELLGLLKWRCG